MSEYFVIQREARPKNLNILLLRFFASLRFAQNDAFKLYLKTNFATLPLGPEAHADFPVLETETA